MAFLRFCAALSIATLTVSCGESKLDVWEQLRIVGSSNVAAYGEAIADEFVIRNPDFKRPVVESTGTGKGIELFCGAIGGSSPDIVFASRRMKKAEADDCLAHGIQDSVEFTLGLDGLVLVQSNQAAPLKLTRASLYQALARSPYGRANRTRTWAEIDPALLKVPVLFYGPPSTTGTHGGVADGFLKPACPADARVAAMKEGDKKDEICKLFREDGSYVTVAENSEVMLKKLMESPNAVALASTSFLRRHADQLRAIPMEGILPKDAAIIDGSYPGSRTIYVYAKRAHLKDVPGLKQYMQLLADQMGPDGLLPKYGLIPSPEVQRAQSAETIRTLRAMDVATLK